MLSKIKQKFKSTFGLSLETGKLAAEATAMGIDDNRGQMGMGMADRAVNLVIGLAVGALVAAFVLPIALEELFAVETTDWDSGAAALWDILGVIIVLAVFLFFVTAAIRRRR